MTNWRLSKTYLWIRAIVLAIVLFGVGAMVFQDLVEVEETGQSRSLNVVLAIAYDVGGKWGVMITWAVFSIFFVILSLKWTPEAGKK